MCHGKIAPKSSSEFVVTSVGHGVFLQLVILCALLGDGLASGKFTSAFCVWEGKTLYQDFFLEPQTVQEELFVCLFVLFYFIIWYVQHKASSLKPNRVRREACW
jgi:hypothetical protein